MTTLVQVAIIPGSLDRAACLVKLSVCLLNDGFPLPGHQGAKGDPPVPTPHSQSCSNGGKSSPQLNTTCLRPSALSFMRTSRPVSRSGDNTSHRLSEVRFASWSDMRRRTLIQRITRPRPHHSLGSLTLRQRQSHTPTKNSRGCMVAPSFFLPLSLYPSGIECFRKVVFPAVARRVEWSDSKGWDLKPDRRTHTAPATK